MSKLIDIPIPDIGDFDTVDVIEVLVAVGDTVNAEQSLITVESDKSSMEIPSSQGGVVKAVLVKIGDKVKQGSVILQLEASAGAAPGSAASASAPASADCATSASIPPASASPAMPDPPSNSSSPMSSASRSSPSPAAAARSSAPPCRPPSFTSA
jgi:pyruvate/2-oxoglutarate dehydrogenase complex dihydrolipoamide acyltransferase (E2) component